MCNHESRIIQILMSSPKFALLNFFYQFLDRILCDEENGDNPDMTHKTIVNV